MIKKFNKKHIYSAIGVLALLIAIGAGTVYARDKVIRNKIISISSAKNFALIDAEVSENDIYDLEVELERGLGRYFYDVEFYLDGIKYSYHIDALDGRILAKTLPTDLLGKATQTVVNNNTPKEDVKTETTPQSKDVTQAKTEQTGSTAVKSETKTPSSPTQAVTGTEKTQNITNQAKPANKAEANKQSPYLSIEKIKEISLKNAGVKANEAIFESTKLERENGRDVYEVEFFTTTKEYDYEIDAHTGEILHYSYEPQNKVSPNIIKEKQNIIEKYDNYDWDDDAYDDDIFDDDDDIYDDRFDDDDDDRDDD